MENPFDIINAKLDLILSEIKELKGQNPKTQEEWGDIHFASTLTGYKIATLYLKVHKKEIPFVKRDGKLYFKKSDLMDWIATGNVGGYLKKTKTSKNHQDNVTINFDKVISMVEEGCNIYDAIEKIGVDRGTFYNNMTNEQKKLLQFAKTAFSPSTDYD